MPTNRFGYSDDFVLNNGNVGINSATPQEKLDVVGSARGDNLKITGVSSFTSYEGFLNANQNILESISLEAGQGITGSLSGEIIVGTGVTVTGIGSATSGQGYIESLKVYNTFTVPVGGTVDRPSKANPGQLYYNKDFSSIEFYDGDRWRQVDNTTQRGRGVWMGGEDISGATETEGGDYVNISSLGNSLSFGDLSTGGRSRLETAGASSVRGVFGGGRTPGVNTDIIDYITIASEGKAIDFGDAQQTALPQNGGTKSSSTRGVFGGGTPAELQYIHISTLGNSLSFGDLTASNGASGSSASSPTRGVFATGAVEAITFSSTGRSEQFGDCPTGKANSAGAGNSVRGVFGGAYLSPGDRKSNAIEYVTLSTLGNAIDFGDLTVFRACLRACSTQVRAVFGGGYFTPSTTASGGTADNRIDYITIASTGDAQDFGDLSSGSIHSRGGACSDSHGGLGGF